MYTPFYQKLLPSLLFLVAMTGCLRDEAISSVDTELERTLIRLSDIGTLNDYILPDGSNLAGIPAGIGNPLTLEKVELGKLLFFETALGRDAL
ncbi:cytochrome-c peroxidase [Lewinella sp. W8]|uniref:cytochrome-c peroxidase n=1 Tax=Lewinella sp. W8 TaxID=2528208 RepID=UPI001C12C045|nr:cytochrome-c peroxidase [Lewinella sp. W8]